MKTNPSTALRTGVLYYGDNLQIAGVEEMLAGKRPQVPSTRSPFAQAPTEREERRTKRML
jgi:hypothetical protein